MAEKTINIEGAETLNALFAGDLVANIKAAEKAFNVEIVARDCWMKMSAPDITQIEKSVAFFELLEKIYATSFSITQKDFDLILSGCTVGKIKSLGELYSERIKVSPLKKEIVPRTPMQCSYIKAMREKVITFGVGPAGTGKTYLATAVAVSEFLKGNFNKIILARPAMEAGENLGFLPGSLEEKIKPFLRPLYDALFDMLDCDEVFRLIEHGIIEMTPLAFMRGRTLNNAFIILDEAQNTTSEQMLMFLTRIGFHSKCVVTGDPNQSDLPVNITSGLVHACNVLNGITDIDFSKFTSKDVVRNSLVEKIISAYDTHKLKTKSISRNK